MTRRHWLALAWALALGWWAASPIAAAALPPTLLAALAAAALRDVLARRAPQDAAGAAQTIWAAWTWLLAPVPCVLLALLASPWLGFNALLLLLAALPWTLLPPAGRRASLQALAWLVAGMAAQTPWRLLAGDGAATAPWLLAALLVIALGGFLQRREMRRRPLERAHIPKREVRATRR